MRLSNRMLYTGDCTYLFADDVYNPGGGAYTAKIFRDHVDLLADSGVDTFVINPNGQTAVYPSPTMPKLWDGYTPGDREFFRRHMLNCQGVSPDGLDAALDHRVEFMQTFMDLLDAGVDWIAEQIDACHQRGIAHWATIRMNDMHGSGDPEGSFLNCPLYRNPAMRLKAPSLRHDDGQVLGWQGFNFERREVRDYMLAMIRDITDRYPFEGIELDWLRNPFATDPVASQDVLDMMVDFTAEIRAIADAQAGKLGKPCPLGLRIPANYNICKARGLDFPAMVEAGLIDFISPSNFWQTSWDVPHDTIRRDFGDRVTIFGVVEDAPNWVWGRSVEQDKTGPRMLSASAELLRGNAAGKLALGAEGIEVFNFFCTEAAEWMPGVGRQKGARYEAMREMSDLEALRGKPKHYAFSSSGPGTWYPPYEMPEQLPIVIEPQARRALRLPMCAEPTDADLEMLVQVIIEGRDGHEPDLGVSVNGHWPIFDGEKTEELACPVGMYTHVLPEHMAYNYRFDVELIREGWNEFVIYNNAKFYDLVTMGHRCTSEENVNLAVRVLALEPVILPAPRK